MAHQVRVARALARFPLTRAAFERGELSYSQVRAIVRLDAPDEHEEEVVALARHATGSHLERIVRSYRRASASDEERRYEGRSVRSHWDDDGCLVVRARLTPEDGALFLAALKAAEAVSAESGEGESLALGRRSYRPNRAQRRAMARRDKRRCRFPGCQAQRYVDAHHVDWWTRDHGETNLEVLVTLCRHHHRLVHKKVIAVVADGKGGFCFVRADGTPIAAGEPVEADASAVTCHADVDAMTAVPRWGGERLDMDHALTALFSWVSED